MPGSLLCYLWLQRCLGSLLSSVPVLLCPQLSSLSGPWPRAFQKVLWKGPGWGQWTSLPINFEKDFALWLPQQKRVWLPLISIYFCGEALSHTHNLSGAQLSEADLKAQGFEKTAYIYIFMYVCMIFFVSLKWCRNKLKCLSLKFLKKCCELF